MYMYIQFPEIYLEAPQILELGTPVVSSLLPGKAFQKLK